MNFGDIAKNIGKEFLKKYINRIKIIAILIVVGIVMLVVIIGAGASSSEENSAQYDTGIGEPTGWWWPIGSTETTTENGKLFASDDPALGKEVIYRMGKTGSAYGITKSSHPGNYAIDISPGETNKYNIISIGNGTVKSIGDGIEDGDRSANGGRRKLY